MQILFIADTHDFLDFKCIDNCLMGCVPDCIIGLGDISFGDYRTLQNIAFLTDVPKGAFLGNHDSIRTFEYLSRAGIKVVNLDKKPFSSARYFFSGNFGRFKIQRFIGICFSITR